MNTPLNFEQLVALCQRTHEEIQGRAVRAVDLSLVVRNWLFGRYIVEYEQRGADRAVYGARFLESLARRLRPLGIKGTGPTNPKLFRQFYLAYREIGQTLSDFSGTLPGIGQTLSDESASAGLRVDISPADAHGAPMRSASKIGFLSLVLKYRHIHLRAREHADIDLLLLRSLLGLNLRNVEAWQPATGSGPPALA